MIERAHLKILREINRQGSVTAAADKLCLTQSALSHTIRKLEGLVGCELWEKKGRNIHLTQTGEFLLKEAERILPQLERIDTKLKEFANNEIGTLNIGMECHPCYQWLTQVSAAYLKERDGIDLDVKQRFQFGGMAALFNHDIDILVTPDPIEMKAIHFEPVFPYELVLIVNDENPLAKRSNIQPQDLAEQTLITYPVEPERLDIFQQFLLPANCRPKKHKTMEATEIIIQMVSANRGVTVLPNWLANEYTKNLPVQGIRLGKEGVHKQIHLGIRIEDSQSEHIQSFIKLAKEHKS
ncbi:LysR family transcriptional regulator [Neptuniibacter sp. QD72_48]|uniref:LysR family transcriptional regulator n=1 Tax=unclassified Neptuniibacter TaxID=2630693 RepID=UPI0039F6A266